GLNSLVVHVRATFLDGTTGCSAGVDEAGTDEQIDESAVVAAVDVEDLGLGDSGGEGLLVQVSQLGTAERCLGRQLHSCGGLLAVDEVGHLPCEATLRLTAEGTLRDLGLQLRELLGGEEREPAEVTDDIGVGGVDEVLVPGVRAGHLRVEPEGAATGGLAELLALGV